MISCLVAESPAVSEGALEAIARACSPRVATYGPQAVLFDASGLKGLFGMPEELARAVHRLAAERDVRVRVALASTSTAAWILAHAALASTVVAVGRDADVLSPVRLTALEMLPEI